MIRGEKNIKTQGAKPSAHRTKTCPKQKSVEESGLCPVSDTVARPTAETSCPFLASKNRLERSAALAETLESQDTPVTPPPVKTGEVSGTGGKSIDYAARFASKAAALATPPGPSTLAIAKGLGLEFRKQGRGLDFWKTKWKELSPERALELAASYDSFQVRAEAGDWSPVTSIEELQQLIQKAEKDAKIRAHLAAAGSAVQQVTDSIVGLPVVGAATSTPELGQATGPKKVGLLSFARTMLRHYDNPISFLQEFHGKHGRSIEVKTPTHGNFLFDTRSDILMEALASTDGKDDTWKKSELQTHGASFLIGKRNMFASGGADHKAIRSGINPHLSARNIRSPQMLNKLTGIFDDHLDDLKTRAANSPNGEIKFNARLEMQTAVLDVAMQLFLSTKIPKSELRELRQAFNTQMSWLPEETVNPTNISLANLPGNGDLREAYSTLDSAAQKILDSRKASKVKPGDMLDSFIEATDPETGEPFSDQRVKHEILALLEAGHETTATMLGWSLLSMAKNPQEFKALQSEVDTVVGKDAPEKSDIKELDRAENIVKETLRMYPPFYLFMRQAKQDMTVGKPGQEVKIEKGTTLVSSLYDAHRDEALWGEEKSGFPANEFHSDRFLERPAETFLPFGAGKRSCPGRVLGKLEGSLMLTRIAQDFDILENHEPIQMNSDLSIHPKDGEVTLRLRDFQGQ